MIEKKSNCRGFTLVEMMVSLGIATVLMVLLLSLVGAGSEGYATADRDVRARTEGRAALHFFERDFAGRVRGRVLQRVDDSEGGAFPSDELGFLCFKGAASQEAGKNGGVLCFARYYTAITADGPERVSRKLFRQFVSSADVFPKVPADPEKFFPAPGKDEKRDEIIALNVLQFSLRYLVYSSAGGWVDETEWEAGQSALPAEERGDFAPGVMEVTLRVVDHARARRMTAADWDAAADFGTAEAPEAAEAVRTYKMQIPLK